MHLLDENAVSLILVHRVEGARIRLLQPVEVVVLGALALHHVDDIRIAGLGGLVCLRSVSWAVLLKAIEDRSPWTRARLARESRAASLWTSQAAQNQPRCTRQAVLTGMAHTIRCI